MHRGFSLVSPCPLARCLLLRLASAPFPLSRARSLCMLVHCPSSLPVAFSHHLSLSSSVLSAGFFRRPRGALLSDRGRSQTSAAVDCYDVGVRRILMSGHVGASRTRSSLNPTPPLAWSVARSPAFCPFFALTHTSCQRGLFFLAIILFFDGRGRPFPLCSVFS